MQENNSIMNETAVAKTYEAVDSVKANEVIVTSNSGESVIDVSSIVTVINFSSTSLNYSYISYIGQESSVYPIFSISDFILATPQQIKIDSIPLQPVAQTADTNSVAQVKIIPKPAAAILPEPKSSFILFIVSGSVATFLAALYFFLAKRRKRNILQD